MKCPVCLNPSTAPAFSGTDILFETTPRTFRLNACPACDSLFLNPPPEPDELAAFYPSQYWWSSSRSTLLKQLENVYRKLVLRDHLSFIVAAGRREGRAKNVRLLDIGCGNGTLIGILKQRGFDVVGVDTSAEASRVAAEEYGVKVIVGSLHDAQFESAAFDVITLFHVMEHVTNPHDVLAEVRRVLKPGGALVLQVPNIDSWQFRWFGARWYGLDIPRHVIDYTARGIVGLVEAAGFSVKRVRQFNLRDNAPALISSLFPSLDPVSRPIRQRRRNVQEKEWISWAKHLLYLILVICAYPVTIVEAASGHGATVMIEAHKQ
jgi:2-polyprenyl-3-methyl-5-hydroxy-6-metoxy-1,4-benzoquinol methylase